MASVSLVIPTFNAQAYLPALLPVLGSLAEADVEILFVDSSSTDGTVDLVRSFGFRVHPIDQAEFDHGGTRALAASMTQGELVVFVTQDALLCSVDSVWDLLQAFDDSSVGAAYGRQLANPDATPFAAHLRAFNYSDQAYVYGLEDTARRGIKTAFLSNSFAAYRRSAMEQVGWFKDCLILGEDMFAGARLLQAGFKLAYVPAACVWHSHNYSLVDEFKRYFDIGVFHRCEVWLLSDFGRAESEGLRFVKSEWRFLVAGGHFALIPVSWVRTVFKYLGYKLGFYYSVLPLSWCRRLSMHRGWWARCKPE